MVRSRVLYVRTVRGGVERCAAEYAALARVMERVCARAAQDRERYVPKLRRGTGTWVAEGVWEDIGGIEVGEIQGSLMRFYSIHEFPRGVALAGAQRSPSLFRAMPYKKGWPFVKKLARGR